MNDGDPYRSFDEPDPKEPPPRKRLVALTLDQILAMALKDPLRRTAGLIGEGNYLTLIYGSSTAGKTLLVINLIFALLFGRKWFGRKTLKCAVLYIALEGEEGFFNRIKAHVTHVFRTLNFIANSTNTPLRVITMPVNLSSNGFESGKPELNPHVQDIIAIINEMEAEHGIPVGVVVYDNLRATAPGLRENYAEEVTEFYEKVRYVGRQTGAAPIVVDNTGKDADRGARGTQAKFDLADTAILVEHNKDTGERWWLTYKVRDGVLDQKKYGFRLEPVDLGLVKDVDGDDKEIFSAVVVETDAPAQPKEATMKKAEKAKWELALPVLLSTLADFPTEPPNNKQYPTKVACTTIEHFRRELEATGVIRSDAETPTAREGSLRKQFSRIRDELRTRGHLLERDKLCWHPQPD
jgi:hypothetical protein